MKSKTGCEARPFKTLMPASWAFWIYAESIHLHYVHWTPVHGLSSANHNSIKLDGFYLYFFLSECCNLTSVTWKYSLVKSPSSMTRFWSEHKNVFLHVGPISNPPLSRRFVRRLTATQNRNLLFFQVLTKRHTKANQPLLYLLGERMLPQGSEASAVFGKGGRHG